MRIRSYTKKGPGRMPARCKPGRKPRRRLATAYGQDSMAERDSRVSLALDLAADSGALDL